MSRTPPPGVILQFATLTAAYCIVAVVGLQWAVVPGAGSSVWPAAGVALAGLMLGGLRLWPAVFLGRLFAAVLIGSPQPFWTDILLAATNTLAAALPVLLLRCSTNIDPKFASLADIIRFLVLGAGLSALVAATLGTATLWISGDLPLDRAAASWIGWASGNFVGIATLGTLLIALTSRASRELRGKQLSHVALVLAATALLSWLAFLRPAEEALRTWHVYPVLIWAALAFQVRGACLALLLVSSIAVYGTTLGLGPFADVAAEPAARVALLQQFLAVASVTVLLLAAAADERRAVEALEQSGRELREANAAKEVLLHEVNHRVKNSLQVVVGLLALQAAKTKDADTKATLDDARARVEVVASLHQRLYKTSAHDHVEFSSFARELAEATVAAVDGGALQLKFYSDRPAVLPIGEAVPLALILSELITNAAKHGFNGNSNHIFVSLQHQDDELRLRVADSGPGLPQGFDQNRSTGLGIKIATNLARQLRGKLIVEEREQGAALVVILPLKARVPL